MERFKSINTNFRKNRDHALNKICPEKRQPVKKTYLFMLGNFKFFIKGWCKIALFSLIINTFNFYQVKIIIIKVSNKNMKFCTMPI